MPEWVEAADCTVLLPDFGTDAGRLGALALSCCLCVGSWLAKASLFHDLVTTRWPSLEAIRQLEGQKVKWLGVEWSDGEGSNSQAVELVDCRLLDYGATEGSIARLIKDQSVVLSDGCSL